MKYSLPLQHYNFKKTGSWVGKLIQILLALTMILLIDSGSETSKIFVKAETEIKPDKNDKNVKIIIDDEGNE